MTIMLEVVEVREGEGRGNRVRFSYTFHTYNFLIPILHTLFTRSGLGMAMTTDEGREENETRKIVKY